MNRRSRGRAEMAPETQSPLNVAVAGRDSSTIDMVTRAVRHRQAMLAFQPVMQARAPDRVAFYEGLIRVLDASGRVIPARDFMPVVENTELGREIDCVALELALRTLAQNRDLRLSVNMSARSIGYRRWMQTLERNLNRNDAIGDRLILEISEASAMTVPELVIDFMDRLQEHGISFALDDFGAGNTALRLFRNFFFDAVKIDGQFIRGIHADSDNQVLAAALTGVARQFDMFTVAESVESREDAEFLISIGVDCLQGYLFGAPSIHPPWSKEKRGKASA